MINGQPISNPAQPSEMPPPPMKKRLSGPEVSSLEPHSLVVSADPLVSVPLLKELVSQQLGSFATSAFLPLVAEVKQQLGMMNLTHSDTVPTANYAMQQIQKTTQSFREENRFIRHYSRRDLIRLVEPKN